MSIRLDFTTADLLNCTICLREFDTRTRKPKVLTCGHTVCEECTERLREPNACPAIRCPVCRHFTARHGAQHFVTNFQILGYLAEKEKQERERIEKGEKAKVIDERVQFRIGRSKNLKIHVATKKDLVSPELFLRKDAEGTTTIVIVGKTGTPEEICKYINDHGITLECGTIGTRIVHDEGRGAEGERFTKVNVIAAGQSALKCTGPPAKLEDAEFKDTYHLKSMEVNGEVCLGLVRNDDDKQITGFEAFAGCMTKPSAKRLRELTSGPSTSDKNTPSTSAASVPPAARAAPAATAAVVDDETEVPVAKRTRRGRGK